MPAPPRAILLSLLLLLLLVSGLYWQGLSGPFIFDDGPAITGNGYLRLDGTLLDDWRTASLSSESGPTGRPLAMGSLVANVVAAGGASAYAMKVTNLAIHLSCGVLVFLLARIALRRTLGGWQLEVVEWGAMLAAALWLLAPLHVSTVLYAVQRMAQLSTLFALAGLVLFAWRREAWRLRGASIGDLVATSLWLLLCTLLAVFSKENGILLLWLLPVLEVTLFRGEWAGRRNRGLFWLGWAALLAPLVLAAAILLVSPATLLGGYAGRDFSLEERLWTQARVLWQYLFWMVWPDINSMGFQHDDIPLSSGWLQPWTTLLASLGWALALLGALILRRRAPLVLFALLFYLVGHSMESSIWPLEMVYEHRNYLPSAGVYILLAAALLWCLQRVHLLRPRVTVTAVLAITCTLLFLRVFTWSDQLRLSAVNAANHPASSRSHYFLAESWLLAYREWSESGAAREELANYLILARNQFELMYQRNPRDMAAIVMLYYMDQHHFPELQAYNDWFAVLLELAKDRPMHASDYTALEALIGCFEAEACREPQARVFTLLDTLNTRSPNNPRLLALHYRYLKVLAVPVAERLAVLEAMSAARPGDSMAYQYMLLEQADSKDLGALYETTRRWMAHDPSRRQLTAIRRMFATPAPAGEAAAPGQNGVEGVGPG